MNKAILTATIGVLLGGGIGLASPAAAGCNSMSLGVFGSGQRCDGPVDPSGDFTRCDQGYGMGFGGSRCYVVKFGDPGQPPYVP